MIVYVTGLLGCVTRSIHIAAWHKAIVLIKAKKDIELDVQDFSMHIHVLCGAHVVFRQGIRFSILNELMFQVMWLQMRHPLHLYCSLIPDMHLPNYYETQWINLPHVESSPSKYRPVMTSVLVSIIQTNLPSLIHSTRGLCYVAESNAFPRNLIARWHVMMSILLVRKDGCPNKQQGTRHQA